MDVLLQKILVTQKPERKIIMMNELPHSVNSQNFQRDAKIKSLAIGGASLQVIADQVGVTRQRVDQIIKKSWPELAEIRKSKAAEERAEKIAREHEKELNLVMDSVQEALDAGPESGATTTDVFVHLRESRHAGNTALRFGLDEDEVKTIFEANGGDFEFVCGNRPKGSKYSDSDFLAFLRIAAENSTKPCLSTKSYNAYRNQRNANGEEWPNSQIIMKRFGTWIEACANAGVQAGLPLRKSYERKYTVSECRDFVDEFIVMCRSQKISPSYFRYDSWSRVSKAPSGPTIRNRLGGWSNVKAASIARVETHLPSKEG